MSGHPRWLIVTLILAGAVLAGCDGSIAVRGEVYDWQNAPPGEKGRAYIDGEPLPEGLEMVPLEGARITLFHAADYAEEPLDEDTIWKELETSREGGAFVIPTAVTAPSEFHALLRAEAEGFRPLERLFLHNGPGQKKFEHTAVILLVRED